MLSIVNNRVRPWFEQYEDTLRDAPSLRYMIQEAERDVSTCKASLASAEALIVRMRAKLCQLTTA